MTDDFDDLDALASAYLDGEATDDEVMLVEADAEVLDRVEAFRDLSDGLGEPVAAIDGAVRDGHIAAALDAFDGLDLRGSEAAPVIDLTQRERQRSRQQPASNRGPSGLPRWLGVAAALLLVVGGIGFVSQLGLGGAGDDDSSDTAAADLDAGEAQSTTAPAADSALAAAESAEADTSSADDEAMEETEAFVEDDSADEASEAASDGDEGGQDAAGTNTESTTTTGGLFPEERVDEARQFFDEPLDRAALDELLASTDAFDASLSTCAAAFNAESELEVIGFIPVSVEGEDGEVLLVIEAAGGEPVPVLVDDSCVEVP